MWHRRRDSERNIVIKVEQSQSPDLQPGSPQEIAAAKAANQKSKTIWKIMIFSAWVPLTISLFFIFWKELNEGALIIEREVQGTILNINMILIGFSIANRYTFFHLRDSKSLSEYRKTISWLIDEFCAFLVWIFLFVAGIVGFMNYIMSNKSIFLFSIQLSFFITSLIYGLVNFLADIKAYLYL